MAHVSYFTSQYKRVRQWSYVTVGKVIRWRAFYIWKKICIFLFNATHGWERKIVKLSAPKRVHKKLYFSANLCLLSSIGTIHELLQAPWWIKRRNHSLLKCMPIQHAVCVTTTIEHSDRFVGRGPTHFTKSEYTCDVKVTHVSMGLYGTQCKKCTFCFIVKKVVKNEI